ncbi:MAG TPA: PAS domain-containing protein [Sphingomonas sp.]|nr:PAS domain-containing protein [Sphingomonas sp.]
MHIDTGVAERILSAVTASYRNGGSELPDILARIQAAVYITDPDGVITHYNRACVGLSGRTPRIHQDKWCVTWRLYTTEGEFLPHDECPMAVAIRERRPIRGQRAIAERPDGTRVPFTPYPTPMFDGEGNLIGAINLLVDPGQQKGRSHLLGRATRCRELAASCNDERTARTLKLMATEFEEQASFMATLN